MKVGAALTLQAPASDGGLRISFWSDVRSTVAASASIMGEELTMDAGAAEVLGELVNTVAGRVRSSLLTRHVDLAMGLPTVETFDPEQTAPRSARRLGFRTSADHIFLVTLDVFEKE